MQKIHFVGVGGSGMSGIAEILLSSGYKVSGSDLAGSEVIDRLRNLGAEIVIGHSAAAVESADAVVVSSAIDSANVEVIAARTRGTPIVARAEMLAELMRLRYGIAIAGTHGKTTTTSMVSMVLSAGSLDPTVIIGGRLESLGSGARYGRGAYFVAEADESDGSFLRLSPSVAVVTNIDDDHMDYYGDMGKLTATFAEFVNKVPFYGFSVLCTDDPRLKEISSRCARRAISYGTNREAELRAEAIRLEADSSSYDLVRSGENLGRVRLSLLGIHNVLNSIAAAAVGLELGITSEKVIEGLEAFSGVDRRLQFRGGGRLNGNALRIYDDYGHHPTEIAATLAAIKRTCTSRLVVVFQPHRFSRTEMLHKEIARALVPAERLWILPVYSAGERPRNGVSSLLIDEDLERQGHRHHDLIDPFAVPGDEDRILDDLEDGDVLLTLGAGNVSRMAARFLERVTK